MASLYPYDQYEDGQVSLRSHADEVTGSLNNELQAQLGQAGVEVLRTQLRRLAYAPEIASEMLRRQQAEAVVSARTRIVEGAVMMVDDALNRLSEQNIIQLDEEKKAAMVSNLLVVLCSDTMCNPSSTQEASVIVSEDGGRMAQRKSFLLRISPGAPRCARTVGGGRAAQRERADRVPPERLRAPGRARAAPTPGPSPRRAVTQDGAQRLLLTRCDVGHDSGENDTGFSGACVCWM